VTPALPFVLATQNADKAREIIEIFVTLTEQPLVAYSIDGIAFLVDGPDRIAASVAALPTLAEVPDVKETGATLEENARIKASALADALGILALADDTGLEVDALDGRPGVYSARYAGEDATYADNVDKLLRELGEAGGAPRTARFATAAMARWPDRRELVARGEVEGLISEIALGENGFGYDPVFVPLEGNGRSFAEMAPEEKHAVSHRGRAFRALAELLTEDPSYPENNEKR
jgi:XTP/dITP diphosphohydrolase